MSLTWRWPFHWTALDHTFVSFINSWICPRRPHVSPGNTSIWAPSIFRQYDSNLSIDYSQNTTLFSLSKLRSNFLLYLPGRAPSLRRRRSRHSSSDKFCHTASLSRSMCNLRNQSLIHQWSLAGFLINFSVSLNNFFKELQKWFFTKILIIVLSKMNCCSNNKASWWEDWDVWWNKINIAQIIDHSSRFASVCESCEVENMFYVRSTTGLTVLSGSESCFQELRQ